MRRFRSTAALAVASLLIGACANADASDARDAPVHETPDDDEQVGIDDPDRDFPTDDAREEARGLLGMYEEDLPDEVRIGRRGEEHYALTEDYVLGRSTVHLDDDGSGLRVTSVTVELPDGPETFELQGG